MSKCIVENCEYYSGEKTDKCSVHSCQNEYFKVSLLLNNYLESKKDLIISKTQEDGIINMFKHIEKDNYIKFFSLFSNYLKLSNKKYIYASLALKICKLLHTKKDPMMDILHCTYPFVIDVWNIDSKHSSPAVCYYNPLYGEDITNQMVLKDRFEIPKSLTGFSFLMRLEGIKNNNLFND